MKRINLLFVTMLIAGTTQAQLGVNYDGVTNVKRLTVDTNGGSDDIGIYVNLHNQSLQYTGILSEVTGKNTGVYSPYGIGIKGICQKALDGNYGVYGYVPTMTGNIYNYGAAIYGTNNVNRIILDDIYAGYFDGQVGVNGHLNVSGTIQGTYLVQTGSNSLMLNNVASTNGSFNVSSKLSNLQMGTFYQPVPSKVVRANNKSAEGEGSDDITDKVETSELTRLHYGLNGDDLKEVFPDLVYENEDGSKSINYVEMVPILVQAINELSAKIAALEGGDGKKSAKTTNTDEIDENVQVLFLGQNKPNPFGTSTEIEVSVPESVQNAFVYVYDLQGKKVQQVNITARGKQTVQLHAADLSDGMYLYSLIADGKVVETKRMIIEK